MTRQAWRSADTANVAGQALDGAAQGGALATGDVYFPKGPRKNNFTSGIVRSEA